MGLVKKLKSFFCKFDFFSQPITMRFRQQPNYKTATGGICSVIVIVIFIGIFASTTILTFQKKYISFTEVQFEETTPSFYETNIDRDFMFAVGITGINMNSGERYFDVSLQFREYTNYGKTQKRTTLSLVQCQRSQWTQIGQQFGQTFDSLGFASWLCPPANITLELQGKYTSQIFKFYRIAVSKCSSSLNNVTGRVCINETVIDTYLNTQESYSFNFYFINKLLNPGDQTYISYFIDDSNYFPFSKTTGINADIFVNSFTILTDQSIWPLDDIHQVSGGIVKSISQKYSYGVKSTNYLKLYLRKATNSYQYTRSYRKADDTISYIGGLFSAFMGALFIFGMYTEVAYEIQLARLLTLDSNKEKLNSNDFHFFNYLCYEIYSLFMIFSIQLSWPQIKLYYQSLQEIRKQMDVRLIMKRLQYVEESSKLSLDEHQIKILHLKGTKTIQQNQQLREEYKYPKTIQYEIKSKVKDKDKDKPNILENMNNEVDSSLAYGQRQNKILNSSIQEKITPINNEIVMQPNQKQEIFDKIKELKQYIRLLEIQSAEGNKVSEKIRKKIDPILQEKIQKTNKNPSSQEVLFALDQ